MVKGDSSVFVLSRTGHFEYSHVHNSVNINGRNSILHLHGSCHICDPSGRNQSHVGRVRFPLRAEMHERAHITDSCFIAFITSKIMLTIIWPSITHEMCI